MEKSKEFQGKTLDSAIEAACGYFAVPREKLEIEIINDAKKGILGIIGARKAVIVARKVELPLSPLARKDFPVFESHPNRRSRKGSPLSEERRAEPSGGIDQLPDSRKPEKTGDAPSDDDSNEEALETAIEGLPVLPLDRLDREKVVAETLTAVKHIVAPIAPRAAYAIHNGENRVSVSIDGGEDSGLLIGREGQTLSAVQYLVARIVSRKMGASIGIQLDAGDYKERQDEKVREFALELARRVHETGQPHSTRPLSSYHRRLVHMALHDDKKIVTRSKGDGVLKRVILFPRADISELERISRNIETD